jgi:hypothetical protein
MDFLNHREWGMVFYQVFLVSYCKMSLDENKQFK